MTTIGTPANIDANHPAFKQFMEVAQSLVDSDRNKNRPEGFSPSVLSAEFGRKYVRIVVSEGGTSISSWAFVDRTNGDILKCESWSRPAKHARGNILRGDFKWLSGYGPASIR